MNRSGDKTHPCLTPDQTEKKMESYEGLMDNHLSGSSSNIADYQVSQNFSQFQSSTNMNNSYGNMPGMSGMYSGDLNSGGNGINMSGYNTSNNQQSGYGNMSTNSASSFSMPYDPPSVHQGSSSQMHTSNQRTPNSHGGTNKPIHSCSYCGLVLSSANALVEHKRIHTGDRPFSCHICNKRFTQKAHLNIHKRIHTGEKPYACNICHKRFAQSSHLSSHKRIHTGEKPFVCEICQIGFTQKQRLDTHLKKHLVDGGDTGSSKPRQVMGSTRQTDHFKQEVGGGSHSNDDNSFMQMIGHGMPYIKQEAGITCDNGSSENIGETSSTSTRTAKTNGIISRLAGQSNRGQRRGRRKRGQVHTHFKAVEDVGDQDKSQKVLGASFCSEGMFLHPSGYVAYGGVEESEESGNSPASNSSEPLAPHGSASSGGVHRRKPTVVRKFYSEAASKSYDSSGSSHVGNDSFHHFSTPQAQESDNTDDDVDDCATEDYHNTTEMLNDKNDPPYRAAVSNKSDTAPGTNLTPPLAMSSSVETRSRRGMHQVDPGHHNMFNGDSTIPVTQKGNLTYSGHGNPMSSSNLVKVNSRISLINFTGEELISHLMKRDDVHKCHFCCLIFQDAAMYHIHRNMHEKSDARQCNMCGKLLQDKYDFTAHFLNMHQN